MRERGGKSEPVEDGVEARAHQESEQVPQTAPGEEPGREWAGKQGRGCEEQIDQQSCQPRSDGRHAHPSPVEVAARWPGVLQARRVISPMPQHVDEKNGCPSREPVSQQLQEALKGCQEIVGNEQHIYCA